jgi:hypothetical protein
MHYLPNYSKESASNIWISLGVAHGIMPDITILGSIAHEGLRGDVTCFMCIPFTKGLRQYHLLVSLSIMQKRFDRRLIREGKGEYKQIATRP